MDSEKTEGKMVSKIFRIRKRDGKIKDVVCFVYQKRTPSLLDKFLARAETSVVH